MCRDVPDPMKALTLNLYGDMDSCGANPNDLRYANTHINIRINDTYHVTQFVEMGANLEIPQMCRCILANQPR